MVKPKIYVDFHNADSQGRIRLNCVGTLEDLAQQQVQLHEGLALGLYSDDLDSAGQLNELLVDGIATFSQDEHCWVATIDWAAIRHASGRQGAHADDTPQSSLQVFRVRGT
jgi:hypothetical protein